MKQRLVRRETMTDTYFGITVEDPYRWMEDLDAEEMRAWVQAQHIHSRTLLDALPERAQLLKDIIHDERPHLSHYKMAGERIFYLRSDSEDDGAKLIMRRAEDQPEKVVVDPNRAICEMRSTIDWYVPSPDGQYVAYGLSQGGSSESVVYVVETDSARIIDTITQSIPHGIVFWVNDNRSFLYRRLSNLVDTASRERLRDSKMYIHHLNKKTVRDTPIFGRDVNPTIEIAENQLPQLYLPSSSPWAFGFVRSAGSSSSAVYLVAKTDLFVQPTTCTWQYLGEFSPQFQQFVISGDIIYFRTSKNAPHFQVVKTSVLKLDLEHAEVVVPESDAVLQEIGLAGEYLLLRYFDGSANHLHRILVCGGPVEEVPLPINGFITDHSWQAKHPSVFLEMCSWTSPSRVYRYNIVSGSMLDTGWLPSSSRTEQIEAYKVYAPAKDALPIPITLVHQKGLQRDGSNITMLLGYGSFGVSPTPTWFSNRYASWLKRGGILAIAHVRGGGEYGKEWHEAGRGMHKVTTIEDFIACAEYLIAQGYTRSGRLAGNGECAGSIPVGGALVRRPDLWGAIILRVPITNPLRLESVKQLRRPEYGNLDSEEDFRALLEVDSYSNVHEGTSYPAVLLTMGLNDRRIPPSQAAKLAARLQAATISDNPVLLKVEFQSGHVLSSKKQAQSEDADIQAFILQYCDKGATPLTGEEREKV